MSEIKNGAILVFDHMNTEIFTAENQYGISPFSICGFE